MVVGEAVGERAADAVIKEDKEQGGAGDKRNIDFMTDDMSQARRRRPSLRAFSS
jgi:hypothetical protein